MKAIPTEHTNITLVAEEANDLPAERITIYRPDDEPGTPVGEEHAQPGYETTWVADEGERKAIANGAPVLLRVWGPAHPPVSVTAGSPNAGEALLTKAHADRAAGYLMGLIGERILAGEEATPAEALELWQQALTETADEAPRVDDAALDR